MNRFFNGLLGVIFRTAIRLAASLKLALTFPARRVPFCDCFTDNPSSILRAIIQ